MGTTVDGKKRTNSRYCAPDHPVRDYYGGGGAKYPAWSGNHDQPVFCQNKLAVQLCDVPERPISKYHTDIWYGDKASNLERVV